MLEVIAVLGLDEGFDGFTDNAHEWVMGKNLDACFQKYDHPLYKKFKHSEKRSWWS